MGRTCGRRERRTDSGTRGGAILSRAWVATVKGTLVRRMPSAFAGGRWKVNLGRSVPPAGGSFPGKHTHRRQQVSSGRNEEGNVVSMRKAHALIAGNAQEALPRSRTRPSLGPETRARDPGFAWDLRFAIAVGQIHETKVSGRNRHRGWIDGSLCGSPRAAALARERT